MEEEKRKLARRKNNKIKQFSLPILQASKITKMHFPKARLY